MRACVSGIHSRSGSCMRQCTMDNGVCVYLLLFITMTDGYLYVTWFSLNRQYVIHSPLCLMLIFHLGYLSFAVFLLPFQINISSPMHVCSLVFFFLFSGCRTDIQWVTQGAKYETAKLLSCIIVQKWAKNT